MEDQIQKICTRIWSCKALWMGPK